MQLAPDGTMDITVDGAATDVVLDVTGYYNKTTATWTYTYDTSGLRQTKTSPPCNTIWGVTTTYAYGADGNLLQESSPGCPFTSRIYYIYGPGGLPVEQLTDDANATLFFHHDQLGSTRLLTNLAGDYAQGYIYGPYGTLAGTNPWGANTNLRWAGQYHDTETGYVYLRHRYYDPTTAQFTTRDPINPITRSPYAYVGNSPLNGTDPSGLICITGVAGHDPEGNEICNGASEVAQNLASVGILQQQAPCDPASPQCINSGINQLQQGGSHLEVTGPSGCLVIWCRNGTFTAKSGLTYQDAWGLALMFQVVGFNYVSKPSEEWNGRVWCVSVLVFQGCRARDGNWSCGGGLGLGAGVYTYES